MTEPQTPKHSTTQDSKRSGYAHLGNRISTWTTNSVLTLIVLVVGVSFGRQVLDWWGVADSPSPQMQNRSADVLDNLAWEHGIRFGNHPWTLRRISITGDRTAAVKALCSLCCKATASSVVPTDRAGVDELSFLEKIDKQTPVAHDQDTWQVYELDHSMPMAVGTRRIATPDRRVVTWTIGLPTAERSWTLYAFQSTDQKNGAQSEVPDIQLPPKSRRTLSIHATGGDTIVGFRGTPSSPDSWTQFFDNHKWQATVPWQRDKSSCFARFTSNNNHIDIQFQRDHHGTLHGIAIISRAGKPEQIASNNMENKRP